ncbi:prolyl 4-hydroxylase subunit alpha-1-like [Ylistrum balloti]|uniref:prolyl 4-hydroxylase subunit alpha-1-like n=1 Tax=Ylistrum balloti TaxID=509963 RepID=UPI002905DBA7|nr:prolyl 4-hydroxylase subunit alpha-1-like [Ylistrum balloti]
MGYTWWIVILFLALAEAQVSKSVYKLSIVCEKEGRLVEALDRYIRSSLANKSHVDEQIQSFHENTKEKRPRNNDTTEWVGHPINAFHLVERAANGWQKVKKRINCSDCDLTTANQDFLSIWNEVVEVDGIWARGQDVNISAYALWRLHVTYNLDIKVLMSGTILNRTTFPLSVTDVISIGNYLDTEDQIEWFEEFLELADVTEKDSISYKLAMAYYMADFSWKSLAILTELQKTGSMPVERMIKVVRQKAEKFGKDRPMKRMKSPKLYIAKVDEKLCQGNIQSDPATPDLHCYNKKTRIPYYTVKEEVLSNVPRISRFHDVISDTEISLLQDISKHKLVPSTTIRKDNSRAQHDGRISESAWISPSKNVSKKLEQRIELLTGLDTIFRVTTVTSEDMQVVNYGLGGFYVRHFDAIYIGKQGSRDSMKKAYGDRIATWMFYLSTVEEGGATIFPKLNLRVVPLKGSAIFWYNLLPNGDLDIRSQHASCPVLLGSKWIATKWILEHSQVFRKPCKIHSMEEHY